MKETMLPVGLTRPVWDDLMRKELATVVGGIINKWCNNETPLEDCIESATKVLRYNRYEDGYKLAKEFEDEGFESDAELVSELEGVWYEEDKIFQKHIKQWVENNQIKLTLSVGDPVKTTLREKGEVTGEIVKLYPETCQYGFWHKGHNCPKDKGHLIKNAEKVISI